MSICSQTEQYIDGTLTGITLEEYDSHLESCAVCRKEVANWRAVEGSLVSHVLESKERQLTQAFADDLVRVARIGKESTKQRIFIGVAAAASLAVLVFVLGFQLLVEDMEVSKPGTEIAKKQIFPIEPSSTEKVFPSKVYFTEKSRVVDKSILSDQPIVALPNSIVVTILEDDRLAVANEGEVQIVKLEEGHTLIRLNRGEVACEVATRKENERFVVEAGEIEVTVVGTRFAVSFLDEENIRVAVSEGTVGVTYEQKQNFNVGVGESFVFSRGTLPVKDVESRSYRVDALLDGRLPHSIREREESTEKSSSFQSSLSRENTQELSTWRQWIIKGRISDAVAELTKHIRKNPTDHEAWWLLGDCRRKTGSWNEALAAYEEVLLTAPLGMRNRAHFRAGVILQDRLGDLAGAAEHYEKYLSNGQGATLTAEVMLRLARVHVALRNNVKAKQLLEKLISEFNGTEAAKRAEQLLAELIGEQ